MYGCGISRSNGSYVLLNSIGMAAMTGGGMAATGWQRERRRGLRQWRGELSGRRMAAASSIWGGRRGELSGRRVVAASSIWGGRRVLDLKTKRLGCRSLK